MSTGRNTVRAGMCRQTLPVSLLEKLIARLEDKDTVGIALTGSFARQEGGDYSDVDLWHYRRPATSGEMELSRLELIDNTLVSIKVTQVEKDYAALLAPEKAIWAVPGIRQARILLDKDSLLAGLWEAARNFCWDSLQAAADAYASRSLAGTAEEVYKLLDGLARHSEAKTLYAMWSLSQAMPEALLVQQGVLIPTENVFIDLAQAAAGRNSGWTHQIRLALGLELLPDDRPAFISLGIAGLRLYRETAALLKKILSPADARLVAHALQVIQEAGY